eukprot:jgi/Botrbrau1/11981/Bobra.0115s0017.1
MHTSVFSHRTRPYNILRDHHRSTSRAAGCHAALRGYAIKEQQSRGHMCLRALDNGENATTVAAPKSEETEGLLSSDPPSPVPTDLENDSQTSTRLFSNLNERTLRHEPGTVLGAAALVAGTTVGAGILALPSTTQASGFVASSTALLGCWLYSVITALLMAEVAINTMCEVGRPSGISITSMAERTLGRWGSRAASISYAFLHEALLVAYVARGGEVLADALHLPLPAAASLFVAALGGACYFTSPPTLDGLNLVLVAAVVATFLALLGVAAGDLDPGFLGEAHWEAVPGTLPVLALAFVMQNVVPVLASQLEGDIQKVRLAIISGLTLPLLMFVAWDAAILGSLGESVKQGGDPVQLLMTKSGTAAPLVRAFSLLAVATSFIGFVLGLSDFISDIFELPAGGRQPVPYALTLLPPLVLALTFPGVFFTALSIAGTYGVMFLFGILPAAMAWSERYGDTTVSRFQVVSGGRASLLLVGGLACAIITNETAKYIFPN